MFMSYYTVLGLNKEPFSTSPDPEFLYRSHLHSTALQRLEISLRLRRGLNLILGDVGTGKTTLARSLLRELSQDNGSAEFTLSRAEGLTTGGFDFHIMLDPSYKTEYQFLSSLAKMFGINPSQRSTLDIKESIEQYLFEQGVEKNRVVVLLIDEGQKLTLSCLEILRTLLNYETNKYKLLQIVIFGQMELIERIKRVKNFIDRVSMKYMINPLDEEETRQMIGFRMRQAGYLPDNGLFEDSAIKLIYLNTGGYPRKISILCHNALEYIVMRELKVVDEKIINGIIKEESIWQ